MIVKGTKGIWIYFSFSNRNLAGRVLWSKYKRRNYMKWTKLVIQTGEGKVASGSFLSPRCRVWTLAATSNPWRSIPAFCSTKVTFPKRLPVWIQTGTIPRCNRNPYMGFGFILSSEDLPSPSSKQDEEKDHQKSFIHPGCVPCHPAAGLVCPHVEGLICFHSGLGFLSVRCSCFPRSPFPPSPRRVLQRASLGARRPMLRRLMTARSAGQSMVVGALMRDELKS